jgi:gamma-glutamyltranspeptidase / glutathione hydrolase
MGLTRKGMRVSGHRPHLRAREIDLATPENPEFHGWHRSARQRAAGLAGAPGVRGAGGRMGDRTTGRAFATRSEVIARHAMAATSQPLATQIALDLLRQGGNAVDAAIAANAALGLMEPTGCGIGGDLFALVWDSRSQRLHGLNASGRSPGALTLEELRRRGLDRIPPHGPLPVTVPGCVDGWFELHARLGRLPMEAILAPAIRYAREGFPVSEVIAHQWSASVPLLAEQPGFRETLAPSGRAPRKGEVWRNAALAATLATIAREGRGAFYCGTLAGPIADCVRRAGGFLTREDLSAHRSAWVEPVATEYRGLTVWELPPNSQGIVALQILNLLEGFDVAAMGFGSAAHIHTFVEAKKLAFADRARYCADPKFHSVPVAGLISKSYAAERRALIDPTRAALSCAAGHPPLEQGDTVYLTVADEDRTMVSLIQSNFRGFGSGLCPDGLGFCLQDRGELFSLQPEHLNSYAPGKRPFHTIIPAFITRGDRPYVSFGVMGGAVQPQAHAQIVVDLADFGMNLQEAGDAPRFLHSGGLEPEQMLDSGTVHLESGFTPQVVRELEDRGHRVQFGGFFGGYQAILHDEQADVYYGASESRKDGQAAGY